MYVRKKGEVKLFLAVAFLIVLALFVIPTSTEATNLNSSSCQEYVNENSVLTENMFCNGLTPTGLFINANHIALNCRGYNITGDLSNGEYGITNNGTRTNVTIRNCNIYSFQTGINIQNHNWTIENTTISGSTDGVLIDNALDILINGSTVIVWSSY